MRLISVSYLVNWRYLQSTNNAITDNYLYFNMNYSRNWDFHIYIYIYIYIHAENLENVYGSRGKISRTKIDTCYDIYQITNGST